MAPPSRKRKRAEDPDAEDSDAGLTVKHVSDAQKDRAAKNNFPGVRIANTGLETNLALVAGYLGFGSTNELKNFFTHEPILVNFSTARAAGFGLSYNIDNKTVTYEKIFKLMQNTDRALLTATLPLDPTRKYKAVTNNTDSFIYAHWAAAIGTLITKHPEHFPETTTDIVHARIATYAPEDCHRAAVLLRAAWKHKTRVGSQGDRKTRERTEVPVLPYMLTDDDLRRVKVRGGAVITDAERNSLDPSLQETYAMIQERVSGYVEIMAKEGRRWDMVANTQSFRRTERDRLVKMSADERDRYDNEATVFEDGLWEGQMAHLGTSDMAEVGTVVKRPVMTPNQLETFLRSEFQRLRGRIIHDNPTTTHNPVIEKLFDREERHQAITESLGDSVDGQNLEIFWTQQEKLSSVSAETPSYEEACQVLGLDPAKPVLGQLTLKPWQVMGAAWMSNNEQSSIRGGVVADDCGLGKTIQMLSLIYLEWRRLSHLHASGTRVEFRPTLILCPAPIVDVWYSEWERHFQGLLEIRQFYGSSRMYTDGREANVWPSQAEQVSRLMRATLKPDDPASGRVVVVSSVATWKLRTLRCISKAAYAERQRRMGESASTEPSDDESDMEDDDGDGDLRMETHGQDQDIRDHDHGQDQDEEDHASVGSVEVADENNPDSDNLRFEAPNGRDKLSHSAGGGGDIKDSYMYANVFRGLFHRVVIDEGHVIKNNRSQQHQAVACVRAPHRWILSATPMINRASDYLGYLSLFFRREWRLKIPRKALSDSYKPESWPMIPNNYDHYIDGRPLCVLDPRAFVHLVNSNKLVGVVAQQVLHAIYPLLQLRRTKATMVTALGQSRRIGDSIPPYEICTVELELSAYQALVYDPIYAEYIEELHGRGGQEAKRGAVEIKGRRNHGLHRRLCLATFDPNLETFCNRSYERNLSQHIHEYSRMFRDDGLTVWWAFVSPEPGMPTYVDRPSFARFMAAKSPKLQYLCGEIHNALFPPKNGEAGWKRQRLLIFCVWPAVQWETVAFLRNLGLSVSQLRPDMRDADKIKAIREFNNPDAPVDAMVASLATAGLGVNLQGACARVIFMEVPQNCNTLMQGIGRVHRLGQKEIQHAKLLTVDRTYDQILQAQMTNKMLPQIVGEGLIVVGDAPAEIAEMRESALKAERLKTWHAAQVNGQADDIIRDMLGQRSSRATWTDPLNLRAKDHDPSSQAATPRKLHPTSSQLLSLGETPGSGTSTQRADQTLTRRPAARPIKPRTLFMDTDQVARGERDDEIEDVDDDDDAEPVTPTKKPRKRQTKMFTIPKPAPPLGKSRPAKPPTQSHGERQAEVERQDRERAAQLKSRRIDERVKADQFKATQEALGNKTRDALRDMPGTRKRKRSARMVEDSDSDRGVRVEPASGESGDDDDDDKNQSVQETPEDEEESGKEPDEAIEEDEGETTAVATPADTSDVVMEQ